MVTDPIFESEAKALEATYYHKATVKRATAKKGKYLDDFEMLTVYEDIPCAVSFTQGSNQDLSTTTQGIVYDAVLFARPEIDIKAGDMVIANVLNHLYEFRAGEGVVYQSHVEVPLLRNGVA